MYRAGGVKVKGHNGSRKAMSTKVIPDLSAALTLASWWWEQQGKQEEQEQRRERRNFSKGHIYDLAQFESKFSALEHVSHRFWCFFSVGHLRMHCRIFPGSELESFAGIRLRLERLGWKNIRWFTKHVLCWPSPLAVLAKENQHHCLATKAKLGLRKKHGKTKHTQ